MMNNSNHIDNWLQQSAALGNTPFDNANWIAMQQLLEKKRRRKLLIIWFVVVIAILGVALFFLLNKNITTKYIATKNENNSIAETEHQHKKNSQQIDTAQNISLNNSNSASNTKAADINKNDVDKIALSKLGFNKVGDKKSSVKNSDVKHNTKTIAAKSNKNKKQIAIATVKTNNNNLNNIAGTDLAISKKQNTNNNVDDILNKIQNENNNIISKGYLPDIKYMHTRYVDSLKNTIIPNDSIAIANAIKQQTSKEDSTSKNNKNNVKKTARQKNYFEIGVGFASLNIGNEMQTGLIKLNYSISILKNLYIDVGSNAFLFNAAQTQTHTNIYDIQQTAGTIDKIVFFKQTTYKINNGAGIEPSIGLHYQANKIDIGAAFNYGMILNKNNNTQVYTDTMLPAFLLPPTIPANNVKISGGDYNSKNFVGKSYSIISVSCAYALSNKWKLQASYANLFWYNNVEGVLDESKKKNSFYFTASYRF